VPFFFQDTHIRQIEAACGGRVWRFETEEELLRSGFFAEILFTWGGTGEMPAAYCLKNPKLRWFHSFSAGMDPVMSSEIAKLPILITNSSGIHSLTVAESVMGYILAWNRTLPFMLRKQREHVWAKGMTRDPVEAFGKTIGIVGAGSIGSEAAKRAKAFGMHTIGLRRHPAPTPHFDEVLSNACLDDLLSRSDYVVLATPLTPETHHLIGAAQLRKMKPEAFLINVARGAVVDQEALVCALRDGVIRRGGLGRYRPGTASAGKPPLGYGERDPHATYVRGRADSDPARRRPFLREYRALPLRPAPAQSNAALIINLTKDARPPATGGLASLLRSFLTFA
jgi:phosphoglycerate dehydrogenase-like enzyme